LGQTGTGVLSYPWALCFEMLINIEDDSRFIFLTEIKNVGKPETDINV
jgi:hypothetical protein